MALHLYCASGIIDDVAAVIAIMALHETWVANCAIGTSSGLDSNAAFGLLHDDCQHKALVKIRLCSGCLDGVLDGLKFGRRAIRDAGAVEVTACLRHEREVGLPPRVHEHSCETLVSGDLHRVESDPFVHTWPARAFGAVASVHCVRIHSCAGSSINVICDGFGVA